MLRSKGDPLPDPVRPVAPLLEAFLDSERFYELMQTYRHAPDYEQRAVLEAFELVKSEIVLAHIAAAPVPCAASPVDRQVVIPDVWTGILMLKLLPHEYAEHESYNAAIGVAAEYVARVWGVPGRGANAPPDPPRATGEGARDERRWCYAHICGGHGHPACPACRQEQEQTNGTAVELPALRETDRNLHARPADHERQRADNSSEPAADLDTAAADHRNAEQVAVSLDPHRLQIEELTIQKDSAYGERNLLVAALSKLWPSHLARHPDSDTTWDDDWRWIVCIHSPVGQLTWHIHDSEREEFDHLDVREGDWDGHTTDEKYARLTRLRGEAAVRPSGAQSNNSATPASDDGLLVNGAAAGTDRVAPSGPDSER